MQLFLTALVEWKKQNQQQLLQDIELFNEEEKELYDSCISVHQVHSKFVPINEQRQTQFIQALAVKVKEQETHQYEGEEKKREGKEIEKEYESTIPLLFILLVERLKELNACNTRGVFRENGDTGERDRYLKLLNDVRSMN